MYFYLFRLLWMCSFIFVLMVIRHKTWMVTRTYLLFLEVFDFLSLLLTQNRFSPFKGTSQEVCGTDLL